MATSLETLATFVPNRLLKSLHDNPTPLTESVSNSFEAAVLFVDISGFTALTESLAQKGSTGVEELTTHLNSYFGQLIELILATQGDIIKFAGDAMLAIWSAENSSLAAATNRAAQCALAILNESAQYNQGDVKLRLHIGIGAGELKEFYVGTSYSQWEYFVAGEPIKQVALAETAAGLGEVCLSTPAWALVKDSFNGTLLDSNVVRLEGFKIGDESTKQLRNKSVNIALEEVMRRPIQKYIDLGVLQRLEMGQIGWLCELRNVSVMFLNLPKIDYSNQDSLKLITEVISKVQEVLQVYEGTLNKFLVDDKGSTLVIGFGLPPFSHEDDAARCPIAGITLLEKLRTLGIKPKIGIATGTCYSGVIGNQQRQEYTIIGSVVNLAARLMQAATDGILCDEKTFEAGKNKIEFATLTPIFVKGRVEQVPVFKPIKEVRKDLPWWMAQKTTKLIVGRQKERALLEHKLQQLTTGISGVVLISGDAGIGKSRLVDELLSQAQNNNIVSFAGAGDAVGKSQPYHAWFAVFNYLLDLSFLPDLEAKENQILDLLADEEQWLELAPLLNPVLGLDLPETEVSTGLTGTRRAEATINLLIQLLQDSTNRSPKVVVIEDAHWLDSSSWALTLAVTQQVTRLLLVIATRPLGEDAPEEYQQLLMLPGIEKMQLQALPVSDTKELLSQRLGVNKLPDSLVTLIENKAEGNPFFSEELVYSLRESGAIEIEAGECRIAAGVGNLQALNFANNVQGVISSRIDRLNPNEQLTLKIASAIGRSFSYRLLRDIHPIEEDKLLLSNYMTKLERFDLTPIENPEPDLTYIFKHIITQEVAYELMLNSQKRQIHETLALWYEQNYQDELSGFYTILAHHWSLAEVAPKAIFYLEKAGEQAVKAHALKEAVHLFTQALNWVETLPETVERKEQELRLLIALGSPLMVIKGFGSIEVKNTYDKAIKLCQEVGQTLQLLSILTGLSLSYFYQSNFPASLEFTKQIETLAKGTQNNQMFPVFYYLFGSTLFHLGEFKQAVNYLELGITTYDPEYHNFYVANLGQDAGVASLFFESFCTFFLGYPEVATHQSEQMIDLAQKLSHPVSLAFAISSRGALAVYSKQVSKASHEADALMAVAAENDFPLFISLSNVIRAWVAIQLNEPEVGINLLETALKMWKSVATVLCRHSHLTSLAEGYLKAGKPIAALETLAECIDEIERTKECFGEAEVYRMKGEVLLDLNRIEEAEENYLISINVARRQEAKSLELRTTVSLCRLWQQQGKTREALASLEAIYGWFTEGFDMPDLIEARQLLDELS